MQEISTLVLQRKFNAENFDCGDSRKIKVKVFRVIKLLATKMRLRIRQSHQ